MITSVIVLATQFAIKPLLTLLKSAWLKFPAGTNGGSLIYNASNGVNGLSFSRGFNPLSTSLAALITDSEYVK